VHKGMKKSFTDGMLTSCGPLPQIPIPYRDIGSSRRGVSAMGESRG